MAGRGLSYDQGPDFSDPLRLFLAAPLFMMLAAVAGLPVHAEWLASRWSPAALALTHLVTLGFLGTAMQGALLQMLPVVLGSPVPRAGLVSRCGLAGLATGTPLLAAGLWFGGSAWLVAALAALAVAWLPFLAGLAVSLARALTGGQMDWPLRLAFAALAVTLATGAVMAGGLAGLWPLPGLAGLLDNHVAWGLFGWVAILIVGVAYQVVPMLQLTRAYPRRLTMLLGWILPAGLVAYTLATGLDGPDRLRAAAWIASGGGGLAFVAVTLYLLHGRRRKLPDVTLDFWRLGLVSFGLSIALYGSLDHLPGAAREQAEVALGLLFLLGFAAAVVGGMLYKIVPFLAWFHLQSQTGARAGSIPNMREMIAEPAMRAHFRLHLLAVCLLVPAPFAAWLAPPGLLALALGGHRQWRNLRAVRTAFLRHGGRLAG